jgi:hypothetical protein
MPAKGDGITKRKDGRYMARYTVQTPDGPKRKVIYGRKYKEVEKKLNEVRGDAARGVVFDAVSQTVGEWLERWLEDVVKPNKTHRTEFDEYSRASSWKSRAGPRRPSRCSASWRTRNRG